MSKKSYMLIVMILVYGLMSIYGCSSDNSEDATDLGAGIEDKPPGDTLDLTYHTVLGVQDWVFENMELLLIQAFWMIDGRIGTEPDSEDESLYKSTGLSRLLYDSTAQYWHYEKITNLGAWEITQYDSAQFYHGNDIVQWPDSVLLTEVHVGGSWLWTLETDDGLDTIINTGVEFELASVPELIAGHDDAMLSGIGYCQGRPWDQLSDIDDGCGFEIDMTINMSQLAMTIRNVFNSTTWPLTGTIEMTGPITLTCTGDTPFVQTDIWNIETSYTNGVPSIAVENSDYIWDDD